MDPCDLSTVVAGCLCSGVYTWFFFFSTRLLKPVVAPQNGLCARGRPRRRRDPADELETWFFTYGHTQHHHQQPDFSLLVQHQSSS